MPMKPIDTFTLDCAELAIWQCRMGPQMDPMKSHRLFVYTGSSQSQPDHPSARQPFRCIPIDIDYAGKINDRMAGFYRSRIKADPPRPISRSPSFRKAMPGAPFPAWIILRKRPFLLWRWSSQKT
jgi:hypothetical protein